MDREELFDDIKYASYARLSQLATSGSRPATDELRRRYCDSLSDIKEMIDSGKYSEQQVSLLESSRKRILLSLTVLNNSNGRNAIN